MAEKNYDQQLLIKQNIQSYERDVPLIETICACPYCGNTPFMGHPNRKYCTQDALLEARRREQAQKAREEGRKPGKVGRPPNNPQDDFSA